MKTTFNVFTGMLDQVPEEPVVYPPVTRSFSIPLTVWDVEHTFPYRPAVVTFDQNGNEIEGDISYESNTVVRVTWGFPMTGSVELR